MLIILLTILTQIGGLLYLLTMVLRRAFKLTRTVSVVIFIGIYLLCAVFILPFIAPLFGRTALPLTGNLRPLNYGTCILNRHYVRTEMKSQLSAISAKMAETFEGTITNYLDANFPFFDGFPLLPHLSHSDGRKLDIAFYYLKENKRYHKAPNFMGYGAYEQPEEGEQDYAASCEQKGYWQYSFLSSVVPQWHKDDYALDVERTRELIKLLAEDQLTSKLFIEPHLKQRWQLTGYDKIRFHGCQAVRHDDHIHTQIK